MKKFSLFIFVVILLNLLFACFEQNAAPAKAPAWEKTFEAKLNATFAGEDSGIIRFEIDQSLIYVYVDSTVPLNEYDTMARAWARKYSEEKQKHAGSAVTAYIVNKENKGVSISYSKSKGFTK